MGARVGPRSPPPPARGQRRKYSDGVALEPRRARRPASDHEMCCRCLLSMRSLLEFLGFVEPDSTRREPVALPAWATHVVPIIVVALTLASMVVFALVRAIAG